MFPEDQTDFSRFFEYRVVNDTAQAPFDEYAWQAFVALNWAELGEGAAQQDWRSFVRKQTLLGQDLGPCEVQASAADVVIARAHQSDGAVLIDQDGNFIVYETRLNSVAEDYVLDNALNTSEGRTALTDPIDFPRGTLTGQGAPALLKFAWQICFDGAPGMVRAHGFIPLKAEDTLTKQSGCLPVELVKRHAKLTPIEG